MSKDRKSGMRRLSVAAALVAVAAATSLSLAEVPAPELASTSVDGGWAASGPIAARYRQIVSAEQSSVTLVDRNGTAVPGTVQVVASEGAEKDTLLFTPKLEKHIADAELDNPYTVTFTARGMNAEATDPARITSRVFSLDLTRPVAKISEPAPKDGMPLVFGPADKPTISGRAFDDATKRKSDGTADERYAAFRSGLARVELQFFNVLAARVSRQTVQTEVAELRQSHSCTGEECIGQYSWTADASGVGTGHWTVRAYAVDRAGNRSLASEVTFTKL